MTHRVIAPLLGVLLALCPALSSGRSALLPPPPPDRFGDLANAIRRAPTDPRALAWLYKLEALRDLEPGTAYLDVLETARRDRRAPVWLADGARWLLLRAAREQGDEARVAALRAELGVPSTWAVIGPFDNLGNRAFAEALAPEADGFAGIPEGRAYPGRGQPVRWRVLPGVGAAGGVDFRALVDDAGTDELAAYAATVVRLARPTTLEVRVGSADSVKVWIDGAPVLTRDVRRDAFADQDVVPVTLAKGEHLVVAKVCRQRAAWQLVLRVTGPAGRPLAGLVFVEDPARFVPPTAGAPLVAATAGPPEPLRSLRAAVPHDAREPEALLARARLERLLHPDDVEDAVAEQLYARAASLAPERADVHLGLALAIDGDADRRRAALEAAVRAAEAAPPSDALAKAAGVTALDALTGRSLARGDHFEAREWGARLAVLAPDHPRLSTVETERLRAQGAPTLALAVAERTIARLPRFLPALRAALELASELSDPRAEGRFAEARLARDATDRAARGRWMALAARSDPQGAPDRLAAAVAADPYDLDLRLQHLAVLARARRLDDAAAALAVARALWPESDRLAAFAGELALRRGQPEAAVAAFDESLAARPQQEGLRRRRSYHAARAGETVGEDAAAATLRALAAVDVPEACRTAGACILRHDERVSVHSNGLSSRVVERVFRIVDRRMRDPFRAVPIAYVPGEHRLEVLAALRLSPDGSLTGPTAVQHARSEGRSGGVYTLQAHQVLSFDDLQAGDVVLVRYRLEDIVAHNPFGSFFGDIHTFQFLVPTLEATYELRVPATRPLHTFEAGVPAPTVAEDGDTRRYTWVARDLPAIVWEASMPGYTEVGAYVNVSTFDAWQDLNAWYVDLVREQRRPDEAIRRTVRELVAGVEDPAERVRRIYGWVVTNTRYVGIEFGIHGFKPYSATQVFQRGYGDCKDKSFLLAAMLGEAGIEASPVLLRTRDRGELGPRPATPWAFNHVITRVPSLDLWLDPTNEFAGSSELHPLDQDALALVVREDAQVAPERTPVLPPERNGDTGEAEVRLASDGAARVDLRSELAGAFAFSARQALQDSSQRRETMEKMLAEDFPGARLVSLETSALDDRERPVTLRLAADVPAFAARSGDAWTVRTALFPSRLAALVATSTRAHDLVLDHTRLVRTKLRLVAPPGLAFGPLPPPQALSAPEGHFTQSFRVEEGAVVVESELSLSVVRVRAADYQSFRTFCLGVDAIERRTLALLPSGPAPAHAGE